MIAKLIILWPDSPVLVPFGQNRVDLFVRGMDSQLYHRWFDGKWQPAQGYEKYVAALYLLRYPRSWYGVVLHQCDRIPGEVICRPHVVTWGQNRLDVFSISPERYLVHKYWNGTSWSGYNKVARICKLIDNVVSHAPNRIDVFYRGVDHSSYHKWYDGNSWFPQSDAGESLGEPSDLSAAGNIPVTGVVDLDPSTKVQPRLEINDLHARHKQQFDLYIRAMANLQARPELSSMSFYGIASMFAHFDSVLSPPLTIERYSRGSIYTMAI